MTGPPGRLVASSVGIAGVAPAGFLPPAPRGTIRLLPGRCRRVLIATAQAA